MDGSEVNWADGAAAAAAGLSEEQRKDFIRLARELQAHRGRWGLFVLEYGHARSREHVAEAVERLVPGAQRLAVDEALHPDWPALEAALVNLAERGAPLVQLIGLERWLDTYDSQGRAEPRLRAWNIRREAFSQAVPLPVLCWLRAPQVELLATIAPDLWSWRAGVHWFEEKLISVPIIPTPKPQPHQDFSPKNIDNRTQEQRISRAKELEKALKENKQDPIFRAFIIQELILLYTSIGRPAERLKPIFQELIDLTENMDYRVHALTLEIISHALQADGIISEALRIQKLELLPLLKKSGDIHRYARTLINIAEALQLQGKLDEALYTLRKEALPIFEYLGDTRRCAEALSRIADAIHAQGNTSEALRIQRDEVLPIFIKINDMQQQAKTLGRIADALQEQGRLNESLHIRRQQELPIYEELHDERERAYTLAEIADTLMMQGDLEEAIRIKREEELPIHEKLGNPRLLSIAQTELAFFLDKRDQEADKPEISQLLHQAFAIAQRLETDEAEKISSLHQAIFGTPLLPADTQAPAGKPE